MAAAWGRRTDSPALPLATAAWCSARLPDPPAPHTPRSTAHSRAPPPAPWPSARSHPRHRRAQSHTCRCTRRARRAPLRLRRHRCTPCPKTHSPHKTHHCAACVSDAYLVTATHRLRTAFVALPTPHTHTHARARAHTYSHTQRERERGRRAREKQGRRRTRRALCLGRVASPDASFRGNPSEAPLVRIPAVRQRHRSMPAPTHACIHAFSAASKKCTHAVRGSAATAVASAYKQAGRRASAYKQAGRQVGRQASRRASACSQAGGKVGGQAGSDAPTPALLHRDLAAQVRRHRREEVLRLLGLGVDVHDRGPLSARAIVG